MAAALLAVYIVTSGTVTRATHGFSAYYTAAQLLAAGELDATVYSDAEFQRDVQARTGAAVFEIFGPNTPMMAWLALPVAWLDPTPARIVWLACSLVAFLGAIAWLQRQRPRPPAWLLVVSLAGPAVLANVRTAQAYLFVAAAYAVAAGLLLRHKDSGAGVVLGLVVACKSGGLPWLALLALEHRWRVIAAAAATIAVCVGATALVADSGIWTRWPAYVAEFVARPTTAVWANQSLVGWTRRLMSLGPALATMVVAIAILVSAWRLPNGSVARIAAGVLLSVVAAPMAEEHQYAAAAVPLLLLGASPWTAVAALLLVMPLEWVSRWPLVAYPRLYALLLMWAGMVASRSRSCSSTSDAGVPPPRAIHAAATQPARSKGKA
jgi:hypothetical protein